MQSNQDILFNVENESEWIYFNVNHRPTPVVEFIPYPIAVSSIIFSDGSQLFTAGGGTQTPWLSNIDANNFSITNLNSINGVPIANFGANPAGVNTQIQWNNNGAFGASANLVWNNANSRMGIGTPNPQFTLEVNGDVNIIGTLRINGVPLALT